MAELAGTRLQKQTPSVPPLSGRNRPIRRFCRAKRRLRLGWPPLRELGFQRVGIRKGSLRPQGPAKRKQGQSVAVELTQQQIAGKQSNSDGTDEQADHCASLARWGMLARASSKIRATCFGL